MTDELKMIFKELVYHIDGVGNQTEWLTKQLYKTNKKLRLCRFGFVTLGVAFFTNYVVTNHRLLRLEKGHLDKFDESLFFENAEAVAANDTTET